MVRALRGAVVLMLGLAALTSCVYTEHTKIMPPIVAGFGGESKVDPYILDHPPQTVAVLPFLNRTDKQEAFDIVRRSFHGHFSKLNYTAMPLFKVDDLLRQAGLETPEKVAQTPGPKLKEILRTDAIIRGDITHYDRIYAAVYSQVAVGAEVRMLEAKSDRELWRAKDVSRKHEGGISTTPVGLILTAVSTALNMREIELLRSSDDLFRSMVKTIPQPSLAQALRPPNITILVHDGMKRADKYAHKAGDVIRVAMEGDPRLRASFRIGDFKKDLPMKEEQPGAYAGGYKVMPGDNVEGALITGTLTNDAGNATDWVDVMGPVTIDSTPPAPPKGLGAIGRDKRADLTWSKNTEKDIARYKLYRSTTPLTGYKEAGVTEVTSFQDKELANYTSYYYKVAAVDLAGNESQPGDFIKATPVTPGPTSVQGAISADTTWYAGASPYVIEGEVRVDPRASLSIEPGTVIQSKGEGISVLGRLIAKGDQSSLITFAPASLEGKWKGLSFHGTKNEESSVEYAKISGAQVGITCLSSSPVIARNEISRNEVGLRLGESFSKSRVEENVIFSNAGNGVEVLAGAAPRLAGNEIRGNGKDGFLSRDSSPVLEKNRILHNGEAGVRLFSSPAQLVLNNVHDNGKYEVFNSPEKDVLVEARDNWWGAKEGLKILGKIFGRVDYGRILDAPYPQGKPLALPILKGPLGGTVERDSFLTLANSPYVVEKELAVEKGAMLTLEPGVTLRFHPGASIVVRDGGIDARGTPARVITFTSSSASPSPGNYPAAVRFAYSSNVASFLRYCVLEYAETALEVGHGSPEIDHCLIAHQSQIGVKVSNEAAPKISFSTLRNHAGTGAVVVQGSARPKMNRNNFQENSFAVQSFSTIYLDARENWWGGNPPGESLFLGEINLKPWLEKPEPDAFSGRKP